MSKQDGIGESSDASRGYTLRIESPVGYDATVVRARRALAEQGFGVLTEIDVRATLRSKLGLDVPAQVILGACRPELAHRALAAAPSIAALLPCNVVVRDADGTTVVEAIDPWAMAQLEAASEVVAVAAEARERLVAALAMMTVPDADRDQENR
jgi:uncharacterized protein (DUF302 family)